MKRVVVTGLGLLTPLGEGCNKNWNSLMNGVSGISTINSFDASQFSVKIAGEINSEYKLDALAQKDLKRFDKFVHYGASTAQQAIESSGLDLNTIDKTNIGVCAGSGIGGLENIEKNISAFLEKGERKISPFYVPGSIINILSGVISMHYNFQGPNVANVSACTTGAHALAWAYRMIQCGDANIMVAGASEHALTPTGLAGFNATRALSKRNNEPTKASRPWDKNRDGFVLSDGSGMIVLEELEHAKKRGAIIHAELLGIGMSSDAHHITLPSPGGTGAALCMKKALIDAKLNPNQIDYINAHGTSTPAGDAVEVKAIKKTLGDYAKKVTISSTKSMTGHTMGAAGTVESIYSVLCLKNQQLPPTINLDNPDDNCDLDFIPHTGRDSKVKYVMSNSFGFGGSNCTLIFGKF